MIYAWINVNRLSPNFLFDRMISIFQDIVILQSKVENVRLIINESFRGVSEVSDDKLIEAVINGDDSAYRELIIRYQQLIFAVIFKIVNNYQDTEDLSQDVFIKAYESLSNFRGEAKFSTWLIKIATNKALDFHRQQNKQASCLISGDIFDVSYFEKEYASDHKIQPELAYINKECSSEIQKQLTSIPDIYRQVLQHSYIDGLSCREIAEKEGLSVRTIASRLYRGKKILRSQKSVQSKGGQKK